MSLLVKITLSAALILSIGVPFGAFAAGEKTKGRYKTALGANLFLFFGTMVIAAVLMFNGNAFAAEEAASAVGSASSAGRTGEAHQRRDHHRKGSYGTADGKTACGIQEGKGWIYFPVL